MYLRQEEITLPAALVYTPPTHRTKNRQLTERKTANSPNVKKNYYLCKDISV